MPGSVSIGKAEIKAWVEKQTDIKTVIDVGAGSGTYRKLLGDKYFWIALEKFKPYVERFNLEKLYNQVIISDISEWEFDFADLIIFGDVLEHLEKEKAWQVLQSALTFYPHVIVSIPIDGRLSKIHYGNESEAHLSKWTYEELKKITNWKTTVNSRGMAVFIK